MTVLASAPAAAGRLDLVFAPGRRGTELAHAHVAAPLKIVRPFDLDGGRALVQILTLGPGLCAGDTCRITVTVQSGARAVVIMQAASRILGMPAGATATQTVDLQVRSGGHLEYYPGLTIPFADSSFDQRVTVTADRDARVGILENWAMGRTSRGEYLRFRRISSRTTVTVDGVPAYADALEIAPPLPDASGAGILEKRRYVASGFWHGVPSTASPSAEGDDALLAFGRTRAPDQVFLRALAFDGHAMNRTLQSAMNAVDAAWGFEPVPLRRFVS